LIVDGKPVLSAPKGACIIEEDTEVEIIEGPVSVEDSEAEIIEIVKVRHLNSAGKFHEGWIPYSFVLGIDRVNGPKGND
jgi:hypothetical protein